MDIAEEKQGAVTILAPSGRLDGFSAPDLEKRFAEVVARGDVHVLLDGTGMDYISSAGLRAVLVGARKCQQGGGALAFCALRNECRSVMETSGFLTMFACHETRDAAFAAGFGT